MQLIAGPVRADTPPQSQGPTRLNICAHILNQYKDDFFNRLFRSSYTGRINEKVSEFRNLPRPSLSQHFASLPEAIYATNKSLKLLKIEVLQVTTRSDFVYSDLQLRLDQLLLRFERELTPDKFEILSNVVQQLLNYDAIQLWMIKLNEEIVQWLWRSGYRSQQDLLDSKLRLNVLEVILSHRAQEFGMNSIDSQAPYEIRSFSATRFFYHLQNKHIFVDWLGSFVTGGIAKVPHLTHGHLLQMMYLAETVPQFPELISYVGDTVDYHQVWAYFFDNPYMTGTVFWPRIWQKTIAP